MPTKPGPPTPKTSLAKKFVEQIDRLREYAEDAEMEIRNEKPPIWYRPGGFADKSLLDIEYLHPPFSRTELEEWFDKVVEDSDSPGTTGDLSVLVIQGDWLHVMERAFRARHHTACRTRIQPGCRMMGHQKDPRGVIVGCLKKYVEEIDKKNKSEPAL